MIELEKIDTEQRNEQTMQIDSLSTFDMVSLINQEDHRVAEAVKQVLPEVARAVDAAYERLRQGGRLIYCGAGTSGRLGVLDAAECPPTFGVDPGLVVGVIAGGERAFIHAVEGAEDDREQGKKDLIALHLTRRDAVVGIAASGRTPYVLGAMDYAREVGAAVMALTCCRDSELSRHAQITMAPLPGPEVITGSSRLKSGTCQKLILNMLSTAVMIKLGKVYGNLMVDVKASNEKLYQRAESIVCCCTDVTPQEARVALEQSGYSCKLAIVMLLLKLNKADAQALLDRADGRISAAVALAQNASST